MPDASATLEPGAPDPIRWTAPADGGAIPPAARIDLLRRAAAAAPSNAALALGLGEALMDQLEFEPAAACLETALGHSPASAALRVRLAQCLTILRRFAEALDVLAVDCRAEPVALAAEVRYLRGVCLADLARTAAAEAELRVALDARPGHSPTFRKLAALLAGDGRRGDLQDLCAGLLGKGVRHSRLLMEWGCAMALSGEVGAARRVLLDADRVRCVDLTAVEGFASIAAFNAALRDELLTHPYATVGYAEETTYPGGPRVHHLLHGRRPDLVRALYGGLEREVDRFVGALTPYRDGRDDWLQAAPRRATIKSWCIVQNEDRHLDWHIHPNGWMQGVYYVSVPAMTPNDAQGRGCIEFGHPLALEDAASGVRIAPHAGMLILSPSQYHHRSVPTGVSEPRIIIAFDVVPLEDAEPACGAPAGAPPG
jgi:hypothetical protein